LQKSGKSLERLFGFAMAETFRIAPPGFFFFKKQSPAKDGEEVF